MFNSKMPSPDELPTTRQLLKSTGIAIALAGLLLVSVVLPAEYGLDLLGTGRLLGLTKMGEIKTSLSKEAEKNKTSEPEQVIAAIPAEESSETNIQSHVEPLEPTQSKAPVQQHHETVVLNPGDAAEVKLEMTAGSKADYHWTADGGKVNFDMHGDPYDNPKGYHNYTKGKMVTQDKGLLQAAFDGYHGWFWRNRSNAPIKILLKTKGAYLSIKRLK